MSYTPTLETALGQKLRGYRANLPQQKTYQDPRPSPMNWEGDGIDHINIWGQAETDLGKLLAHGAKVSFKHSIFGRFSCLESFWHWVRSEEHDDRIRTMTGKSLQDFVTLLTRKNVVNFRAIIMDANYQKVKQYPEILQAMVESTLPFDCYYVYKREADIPIRTNFASWVIDGFEEIRKALKENREPDFSALRDNQNDSLYAALLAGMKKHDSSKAVVDPNVGKVRIGGNTNLATATDIDDDVDPEI